MRAKMKVVAITRHGGSPEGGTVTQEDITFAAVGRNATYPEDGSDEDNTFAKFTPSAELRISICNPALIGKYRVGSVHYVDFSPVPVQDE